MKSCWSCKHCINDYFATGTLDCKKFDDMTEEEIDNYYTNNGGENCTYYEEERKFDMKKFFNELEILISCGSIAYILLRIVESL